jgi:alkanesulfonate monooxygenase SsuD/methylene tetrahydromethanopterin reductase-like flavin-dependent oxidoreductase (luciferase family)
MGGNSDAALKRAARYAAGWMPMTAPASVAKTARTPPVTTTEELRERLVALERFAGDRYEELELIVGGVGVNLSQFDEHAERIRHRIGELEELGVDWTFVGPPWSPAPGPTEWLRAFAETFFAR